MLFSIQATSVILALLVAVLLGTGTYMILRRGQIRLILGLGLFSHGINLMLFGTGQLTRGKPPIILDKQNYLAEVPLFADPLPQALILTAIVISFGVTAFIVVLASRRDALTGSDIVPGELAGYLNTVDPFSTSDSLHERLQSQAAEDYDLLQYELDELYDLEEEVVPFHEEAEEVD